MSNLPLYGHMQETAMVDIHAQATRRIGELATQVDMYKSRWESAAAEAQRLLRLVAELRFELEQRRESAAGEPC